MDDVLKNMRLPTENELEDLKKQNPDIIIMPSDKEKFDRYEEYVREILKMEQECPTLKQKLETLRFEAKLIEREQAKLEWRDELERKPMTVVITEWLNSSFLGLETRRNYAYYIEDMRRKNVIPERDAIGNEFTVGHFRHVNHKDNIKYYITQLSDLADGTKKVRISCYLSLMSYLGKISDGWFPGSLGLTYLNSLFRPKTNKNVSKILSLDELSCFLEALLAINHRDFLIASFMLHGYRRISDVLGLTLQQLDYKKDMTETRCFMIPLKKYIEATAEQRKDSEFVFISRNGKRLTRSRCNYSFAKASESARIKKTTPYMLRATGLALTKGDGQNTVIIDVIMRLLKKDSDGKIEKLGSLEC